MHKVHLHSELRLRARDMLFCHDVNVSNILKSDNGKQIYWADTKNAFRLAYVHLSADQDLELLANDTVFCVRHII